MPPLPAALVAHEFGHGAQAAQPGRPAQFGGPQAPASQGYHQQAQKIAAARHLQGALQELNAYIGLEPDPVDKQTAHTCVQAIVGLLQKDASPTG